MSKAEERALKAYPIKIAERDGYDENLRERKGFIKGYHQAEKDLALTWEDVKLIWNITDEMDNMPEKEFYQEVLKRFKNLKEK